jgi:hypothetical protein
MARGAVAVARGPAVEVEGLKELRRELKQLGPQWPKELRKANKEAADIAASASRSNAHGGTRQQSAAASAIKASGTQSAAQVVIDAGRVPFALGAFLGSRAYPQFPEWVGNSWEPGGPGGPYAVNPAIREKEDEIIETYGDALDRLTCAAFPSGRL